tara:strand:+ start:911 stop:1087 length:177 start_codon:yes stop_codon:yes gene_type:complete
MFLAVSCQLSVKRQETSWEFVLWCAESLKLTAYSYYLCFTESFELTAYNYVFFILGIL